MIRAAVIAVLAAVGVGCVPSTAREAGAQMFADPRFSSSDVNAFSCATCHALGAEANAAVARGERIYPGFPLDDAAARTRFWGGASVSLLDATNACMTFFMRSATPLSGQEPKARALYELLATTAQEEGAALASIHEARPLTIVENVTSVERGDRSRGAKVWDAACRSCHGDPHTGNGRLTELASRVPEDSVAFAEEAGFPLDLVVIEKVRHGAFFGVGGTMPPFPVEQLGDDDLGALLAFLGL